MLTKNALLIDEAIKKVIIFFDMFAYPLTVFEIWQYLEMPVELSNVERELNSAKYLESKYGFYFLPGRSRLVDTRRSRYNYTDRKFERARRVARFYKFIPWIRLIAVGNMMGGNNLKDKSDIDLFIITEPKRIWITRLFCAGLAALLKLRPTREDKRDKLCLSFYITEEAMDLRGLMLKKPPPTPSLVRRGGRNRSWDNGVISRDVYFIYWLLNLVPVYDAGGVYQQFMHANNWVHNLAPNWRPIEMVKRRQSGHNPGQTYRDVVDMFIGGLETTVKKWQLKIMPEQLKSKMNKDTRVVVNDQVLKLYASDRRGEYRERYYEKLREIWPRN